LDGGRDLADWLERLKAEAEGATVLGSILAFSESVESEGRQMKQFLEISDNIASSPYLETKNA
jgi:hypothetical protein